MLREWKQIWWATRRAKRIQQSYYKDIMRANRTGKIADEVESLKAQASAEVGELWADRDRLVTVALLREARALNVPTPDRKDLEMWHEEDNYHHLPTLTAKGISLLRKALREERQARGLYAKIIFTAVISTIGAIAAIVGAIAALANASK